MTQRKIKVPACRICSCTELQACEGGCSWVSVEVRSAPLCSACAGTTTDLMEALKRISKLSDISKGDFEVVREASRIAKAALVRRQHLINSGGELR